MHLLLGCFLYLLYLLLRWIITFSASAARVGSSFFSSSVFYICRSSGIFIFYSYDAWKGSSPFLHLLLGWDLHLFLHQLFGHDLHLFCINAWLGLFLYKLLGCDPYFFLHLLLGWDLSLFCIYCLVGPLPFLHLLLGRDLRGKFSFYPHLLLGWIFPFPASAAQFFPFLCIS